MFTRRLFMTFAAVSTAAAALFPASSRARDVCLPMRATIRKRTIHARPHDDGKVRLYTDASPEPRALIRDAALERAFGKGVAVRLNQPDHWRMIDAGWFEGDDLFVPSDRASWEFAIWQANYHPECEAHDLLVDLFGSGLSVDRRPLIPAGLSLGEHPSSPRFATATLHSPHYLQGLAHMVAQKTDWVRVDPVLRDPVGTQVTS